MTTDVINTAQQLSVMAKTVNATYISLAAMDLWRIAESVVAAVMAWALISGVRSLWFWIRGLMRTPAKIPIAIKIPKLKTLWAFLLDGLLGVSLVSVIIIYLWAFGVNPAWHDPAAPRETAILLVNAVYPVGTAVFLWRWVDFLRWRLIV